MSSEANGSRFGLVRPGPLPGSTFGAQEQSRFMKKPLTYENYMEMLSLLKELESVVGTRQISDYMNALEVAQRNSPVDIDPANVILSMGKLYAEKANTSPIPPTQIHPFSPHAPFTAAREMNNSPPMTYSRNDAARFPSFNDISFGRLNGLVTSAFQEIETQDEMKRYSKHEERASNGAVAVAGKKSTHVQDGKQDVKGTGQIVPFHMLRSQLQQTHGAAISFVEKKITNGSYLLRFNVTTDLARLLPGYTDEFSVGQPIVKDSPRSLFKRNISIIDSEGRFHCVKYEGIVSSKQKHYRLTTGWSILVKSLKIKVGDTVVFERWTPNHAIIHITVIPGKDEWDDFGSFENDLKRKKLEEQESPDKHREANVPTVQETR